MEIFNVYITWKTLYTDYHRDWSGWLVVGVKFFTVVHNIFSSLSVSLEFNYIFIFFARYCLQKMNEIPKKAKIRGGNETEIDLYELMFGIYCHNSYCVCFIVVGVLCASLRLLSILHCWTFPWGSGRGMRVEPISW